jgi:glycosyltransferase involved in cell wall biosynthesis
MPTVDINLFVHNGAKTLAAAIDSVLAQSWSDWRLTLIDDGSTDETRAIVEAYAAAYPAICIKRNRCNTGAVGAFQRSLWIGNADYVMPKSADDLLAPDFIQRIMDLLAAHPDCAMAHAAGLTFRGRGEVDFIYPESHRLTAISNDPVERASEVMRRYTSSPSFWGIYRRDAVDRLAPIDPYCWPSFRFMARYGMCRKCCIGGAGVGGQCAISPGLQPWRRRAALRSMHRLLTRCGACPASLQSTRILRTLPSRGCR